MIFAQTTSGRPFPLLNATIDDVHWPDVVSALAHQNRYAGNAGTYSIAQHSIYVAEASPKRLRLAALLHDAPEFAYGDMTKPAQMAFIAILGPSFKEARRTIDSGIAKPLYEAAGLTWPLPPEDAAAIKLADTRVTFAEKRDIFAQPEGKTDKEWLLDEREPVEAAPFAIEPWPAHVAARVYADELRACGVRVP